ncbi:MAG: IclR family transcriptional regulator [Lautropia sp.]
MSEPDADVDAGRYTVPGLERGLRILAEFSRTEATLTGAELARRLGAPRSTVFRLLMTLESMSFVERTNDGRAFRLGVAVLRLGFEYLNSQDVTERGRPIIEQLRNATGHPVNLVVRDEREIVYIQRAIVASPFSGAVSIGTRLPAHATVLGQVLLSRQSLSQLRRLYPEAQLERFGPNTPTTAAALFELAQAIRRCGFGISEGAYEAHISTIAAPVFDETGQVIAAIGLTVPGGMIPAVSRDQLVAQTREAAARLSALLNYRGSPELPDEPAVRALGKAAPGSNANAARGSSALAAQPQGSAGKVA